MVCAALGTALALHYEVQPPSAWLWFAVATVLLPMAALLPARGPEAERRGSAEQGALPLVSGLLLVGQLWMLLTVKLFWLEPQHATRTRLVTALLLAGAALAAAGLRGPTRWDRARVAGVCACHAGLGFAAVLATPHPWNDIWALHESAIAELLQGHAPYGRLTVNLYRGMHQLAFYSREVLSADESMVKVGFPYPPLQLLLAAAGRAIFGDYRFLQALALTASGTLVYLARPGRAAAAGAALLWFSPRLLQTLEAPPTEPLVVFFLSLTLFCAVRAPRTLPWALGLFFAIKQYGVLLAPLAFLLVDAPPGPERRRRTALLLGKAALLAGLLTLPLALWNLQGFINDVVLFQVRQPFRIDSLSYAARWAMATGTQPPALLGFVALALGLGLSVRWAGAGPAGFAGGGALALFSFFALGKQAFPNYYLVVHALACWALALAPQEQARVPGTEGKEPMLDASRPGV